MKKILLLSLLVVLCACQGENPRQETGLVTYICENPDGGPEMVIGARFFDGGMDIDINRGRDKRTLAQTPVASGARYADDKGIEFWIKGDSATFTSFGASTICARE